MLYTLRRCNPSQDSSHNQNAIQHSQYFRDLELNQSCANFFACWEKVYSLRCKKTPRNHQHQTWKLFESSFYGLGFACLMLGTSSNPFLQNAGEKWWFTLAGSSKIMVHFPHLNRCSFKLYIYFSSVFWKSGIIIDQPKQCTIFPGKPLKNTIPLHQVWLLPGDSMIPIRLLNIF